MSIRSNPKSDREVFCFKLCASVLRIVRSLRSVKCCGIKQKFGPEDFNIGVVVSSVKTFLESTSSDSNVIITSLVESCYFNQLPVGSKFKCTGLILASADDSDGMWVLESVKRCTLHYSETFDIICTLNCIINTLFLFRITGTLSFWLRSNTVLTC